MRRNLVDEYVLLIHPLVLGAGRRLFTGGAFAALRLVDAKTTTTGVVIATYQPAEPTPAPLCLQHCCRWSGRGRWSCSNGCC
jgi:hypothetical protein